MATKKKRAPKTLQLIGLTPEAVRRLPKPRANFEPYAPPLVALYRANIDQMRIKGFDPAAIESALAAYQALEAQEVELTKQLELVKQTRLQHASTVWTGELEIYNRGEAAGRTDPAIKAALAAFEQFLRGKRKKAAASAPTTAPTATAGTTPSTPND